MILTHQNELLVFKTSYFFKNEVPEILEMLTISVITTNFEKIQKAL